VTAPGRRQSNLAGDPHAVALDPVYQPDAFRIAIGDEDAYGERIGDHQKQLSSAA